MKLLYAAIIVEVVGIATTATGLGYEIATGQALGYVLITGGSVLVASGGVLFGKFFKMKLMRH
mgnify:FL=1